MRERGNGSVEVETDGPARLPQLSVVVATTDAERTIEACLSALKIACTRMCAEILVVDSSSDRTLERVARACPDAVTIPVRSGALVPELWARGIVASRAEVVALTTGQCLVSPTWARSLVSAFTPGIGAAGGGFTLASDAGPADWAVFFLRYSAFVAERWRAGVVVNGEIAGDNAAYRRSDVVAIDGHSQAFWDVDVHRVLRRRGLSLVAVDRAVVAVSKGPAPLDVVRHRFAHGREYGAWRVRTRSAGRARVSVAAPLVPVVLAWRAARRVVPLRSHRARFFAALPWFLLFASAWAFGEAIGAWCPPAGTTRP
jgi:hypothetical protein